jgi:2,3-bisphosphoglycerate-dependent phosphoglycerate mutase
MNRLFVMLFLTIASISLTLAQDKTIVLVRHAEKAASTEMDKTGDVDLSDEGRTRAKHLLEIVKRYKPHEIFATEYKRVQQTVEPIAKYRNKQVQIYDPKDQAALVDKIMKSSTEHYLIAGHSNTIPALANLLTNKEIFKQVPDNEYGVIWVVKIRKGVLKCVEVYTY